MDLTPEALRSARFREKLRGYHPDDVDAFLESVAEGLGVLLGRVRDATERARRIETGAAATDAEESVRRTLILAQRTADLAIGEAREAATKLVADAETRAASITGQAQDAALLTAERAQEQLRADLERLQNARDQLLADVTALEQWLTGERSRIKHALSDLATRVEAVRAPTGGPQLRPVDTPARPVRPPVATSPPRLAKAPAAAEPAAAPAEESPREPTPEMPAIEPVAHPPTPEASAAPVSARTFAPSSPPPVPLTQRPPRQPATAEPSPEPIPPPAAAPWVTPPRGTQPVAEPADVQVEAIEPERATDVRDPDQGVLMRAQAASTPASEAEDPYFAELRRAITDPQPLGPRDDDEESVFEGSVDDIFDPRHTSRLRRRR